MLGGTPLPRMVKSRYTGRFYYDFNSFYVGVEDDKEYEPMCFHTGELEVV